MFDYLMLIKKFYISIILIFIALANLYSQDYIRVPDTTLLHNGSIYKIPIYAQLQLKLIDNLEIEFEYDYSLINITGISTDQNNIIATPKVNYNISQKNFKQGFLKITSNEINLRNDRILCYIEMETLFGLDSIAYFNPTKVKINGEEKSNVEMKNGRIFVGYALEPIVKEGISRVFPNPFDNEFIVDFAIESPTELTFTIFSSLGRIVYTFPTKSDDYYQFFDNRGDLISQPYNMKFPKGYYKLKVKSLPWLFSSGLYFLQLSTQNGIYNKNLLHLK